MSIISYSAASYHFYYLEQWGTFYYESDTVWQTLCKPGGVCIVIADFLLQFFYYGAGPFIFGAMMTLVAWAHSRLSEGTLPYLGCITSAAMLLTLTSSLSCQLSGSVCFCLSILLLVVVRRCHWVAKVIAILLLCWIVRMDILIRPGSEKQTVVYLPWAMALVVWLVCIATHLVVHRSIKPAASRPDTNNKRKILLTAAIQLLLAVGVSTALFSQWYNAPEQYMMKIYRYVRLQQWDEIISRSNSLGAKGQTVFQLCRNMALAEKGELGDKFLMYKQNGMGSVFSSDLSTLQASMLLGDVYYTMGYVNMSQRTAFESLECVDNKSPYLWQRLVDTNLENGAYAVAEKYIQKLERTLAYRQWASDRRRYLYNDRAVNADPVLGMKRRCIFKNDCLIGLDGFDNDMERIVAANPEYHAALHYLGCMYIVANQREKFLQLMKKYSGTKAMPQIPESFKKAMEVFQQ